MLGATQTCIVNIGIWTGRMPCYSLLAFLRDILEADGIHIDWIAPTRLDNTRELKLCF